MRLIIVFGLLLTIGCATKDNEFKTYVGQIETLTTPISFATLRFPDRNTKNDYDQRLFDKYKSSNAYMVYGKLFEDENTVTIIYSVIGDYNVPILMTYDNFGHKIDSLNLFENNSGFDFEQETFEYVTIFQDKRIQVIDSIKTWKMEDNGEERIDGTEELTDIDTFTYLIKADGKIVKNKTRD